jgi:hypothetical protein
MSSRARLDAFLVLTLCVRVQVCPILFRNEISLVEFVLLYKVTALLIFEKKNAILFPVSLGYEEHY